MFVVFLPVAGASSRSVSILSWYRVACLEDTMDGSLKKIAEERGFLSHTLESLVRTRPDWMSIPMFSSEDIASKGFLKLETVVELLKDNKEKDNLSTDFPIDTTIQDGGKRKRSNSILNI